MPCLPLRNLNLRARHRQMSNVDWFQFPARGRWFPMARPDRQRWVPAVRRTPAGGGLSSRRPVSTSAGRCSRARRHRQPQQEREGVLITVDAQFDQCLGWPDVSPFRHKASRGRPVVDDAGRKRRPQCSLVHVGEHQHVAARVDCDTELRGRHAELRLELQTFLAIVCRAGRRADLQLYVRRYPSTPLCGAQLVARAFPGASISAFPSLI